MSDSMDGKRNRLRLERPPQRGRRGPAGRVPLGGDSSHQPTGRNQLALSRLRAGWQGMGEGPGTSSPGRRRDSYCDREK